MQATTLWRLACLLVLGSATLASCGKDEGTTPKSSGGGGASAGTPPTSTAGEPSGPVGGNGGVSGGSTAGSSTGGSTTNVGGAAGTGAQPPTGTGGDAGALGNGGNGGGATTPNGEQLVLCTRLTGKVVHADAHTRAFATAVFADCRIKWIVPLKPDLDEYRQQLVVWDLEFWGCQGNPVNDFGLVWGTPALSAGDANLLIEHYLTTANTELTLSTDERVEMKAALDRLAEQLISSPSEEPSQSRCVTNTGGAGGAAGAAGTP